MLTCFKKKVAQHGNTLPRALWIGRNVTVPFTIECVRKLQALSFDTSLWVMTLLHDDTGELHALPKLEGTRLF